MIVVEIWVFFWKCGRTVGAGAELTQADDEN